MPALESLPGKIGPYRIVDKIGEGGMGVVYLAVDSSRSGAAERRQVALKVLGPTVAGEPSARARLAREVETTRRVRSPYVAEIIDADVTGPSPYIVTQFVRGRTLDNAVKQDGPLRGAALQRLAYGLAEALGAIHAAGVVHRDLKPGNVMISGDGGPVVIDFGIANMTDGTRLTQTGIVMGTPGYLAPEVIEGRPSSPASDIHSWGATVAFAATGRQPFGTGTFQTIFYRVLNGQAELDGVPGVLMPLLTAALTRSPRNRPTAQWLAAQCTMLTMNGVAPTIVDQRRPGGTLVGTPDGFGLLGDAPTVPPRPSTGPAGANGAGPYGNGAARAAVRPAAYAPAPYAPTPAEAASGVADLLPGVDYAQRANGVNGARPGNAGSLDEAWADKLRAYRAQDDAAQAGLGRAVDPRAASPRAVGPRTTGPEAGQSAQARPTTGYGLISLAFGVLAVALAIALPVLGTLLALAAITLLRAADKAESALAARRSAYGARPTDILVVIISAPWTVVRAVLTTALLAPLAIVIAALAAGASVIVGHTTSLPDAGSWAAGAAVAWYAVGPGSGGPRRQLRRMATGIVHTRAVMVVAVIAIWCLAVAAVSSALAQAPDLWPATTWMLPHLPSLGSMLHSVQKWLLGHAVSMLHLP
jgi:Protein kinase domain